MSDSQSAGFGKFVPGFDFLQNLAKGASEAMPQMPNLASWVAPTLNAEELDKRIAELKAVHFWLDQNTKALAATVQALEVQKMTLATLKGMNFSMGDIANAFKVKTPEPAAAAKAPEQAAPVPPVATDAPATPAPDAEQPTAAATPGLVDTMQLWTALTQQFQHIAAGAMKEAGKAGVAAREHAPGSDESAASAGKKAAAKATARPPAAKKAVKKVVAKSGPRSRPA